MKNSFKEKTVFIVLVLIICSIHSFAFADEDKTIKKDADYYFDLGKAYFETGKSQEAIDAHKQAIRIKPDHGKAHMFLGALNILDSTLNDKPNLVLTEKNIRNEEIQVQSASF